MQLACPWRTAHSRAVKPELWRASKSVPLLISSCRQATLSQTQGQYSGGRCSSSGIFLPVVNQDQVPACLAGRQCQCSRLACQCASGVRLLSHLTELVMGCMMSHSRCTPPSSRHTMG